MNEIVTCPSCGQKNRIAKQHHGDPICGRCSALLRVNHKSRSHSHNHDNVAKGIKYKELWLIIILLILLAFLLALNIVKLSNRNNTHAETPRYLSPTEEVKIKPRNEINQILNLTEENNYEQEIVTPEKQPIEHNEPPEPSLVSVPLPNNGEVQMFTDQSRVAPLRIETSGDSYYLVKLVQAYTNNAVMTVFVHGGQSVELQVPLGDYEVKYASGQNWYGYEHLFGEKTSYNKADTTFNFQNNGYQISGYTIVLYQVANGNLHTSKISPSEF